MLNVFDVVPSNFFNLLSSQSNGSVYSECLQIIYQTYEHEISYRISRRQIQDALAIHLMENHIVIDVSDEMDGSSSGEEHAQATAYAMASAVLRRFASPEVGWLVDEIDDTTYTHNIVMTEQGIALAEFLNHLMKPERVEFSGYIFDIYNRLNNDEQWKDNPYVNALSAVFKSARDLSKSLKQLSTFIRDIIERMVKEKSLESLTENILEYCNGDFIKEYARLNTQQNIHIYRKAIIRQLSQIQEDEKVYQQLVETCVRETGMDKTQAEDHVDERLRLTRKFLKDDYDRIMSEIRHKINVYLQVAVGRARFLRNRDPNVRGYVEQSLKYLVEGTDKIGLKDELPEDMADLFTMDRYEYIDTESLKYPGKRRLIRRPAALASAFISKEEIEAAARKQKEAAFNPYSKETMRKYVLREMNGAKRISSAELPLDNKSELLAGLSAVAYGCENGFEVKRLEGYYESNHMLLRRFELIDRNKG